MQNHCNILLYDSRVTLLDFTDEVIFVNIRNFRIMKKLIVFSFLALLLFTGVDCKDEPPIVPPVNPLSLAVEDVTCTEVFLTLSLAGTETNRTVSMKRGDSIIATISIGETDSLFIDEGLLPKQTYTYSLVKDNWSASIQATTQDTTSHDIQWQLPDTLGAMGLIRDVWVFSRNNAWAVGEIYLRDSNGIIDNGTRYNAAQWNGTKWEVQQLKVNFRGNIITPPINGIFAFSQNDIWLSSGVPIHGNGETWTQYHLFDMGVLSSNDGSINKLWGAKSNNLFFVGNKGSIVRYSNGNWSKMESHTTVDLQDIWGIDESHIWATGTNVSDGRCVVLQYDGKQWTTIYDNANKPPNEFFGFRTLWTDRTDNIYLAGGSRTQLMYLNTKIFQQQNISAEWVALQIRGRNRRDIFEARDGSEITHFNGVDWHRYTEIKTLNSGYATFACVYPIQDFLLIGGFYFTGLNGLPVVIRGYR